MNLSNLLSTQRLRDHESEKKASCVHNDKLTLRFAKELGDILVAWRGIEYWEEKPMPHIRKSVGGSLYDVMECDIHAFKNPLLETCVTAFSTLLTIGYAITTQVRDIKPAQALFDVSESFFRVFFHVSRPVDDSTYQMLTEDFLALCIALGFDEQTLLDGYFEKTYEWKEHGLGENLPRLTQAEIDAIHEANPLPTPPDWED